jgi:signal transduction histidine kinase
MVGSAWSGKMTELTSGPQQQSLNDLSTAPIRKQLLWAALFPLMLFGLLFTLVITSAFHQLAFDTVMQRNTAQTQALATNLSKKTIGGMLPDSQELRSVAQSIGINHNAAVYLVNPQGQLVFSSEPEPNQKILVAEEIKLLSQNPESFGQLIQTSNTNDQVMVSISTIPGINYRVILVEPWTTIIKPAAQFQLLLGGLTLLGISLTLITLSLAISRITHPIHILAENAAGAVPGSTFYPIKAKGPKEIRTLINAFNQMVIHLAEQQSALRQYSHQALLSQEEERQRLSHELHDGILQDLVGLSQRVELCQNELKTDPNLAKERLIEFNELLNRTLDDVRRISIALRPPVLEDFGLTVAIDALCKEMNQNKPKMKCELVITGKSRRLDADLELAIYRVVQEALTNIRKHVVDATSVKVEVIFAENEILARISNNGSVFTSQEIQDYVRSGHLGLAGMYERARLFGGTLNISSNPGENTIVSICLPYIQEKPQS